VTTRVRASADYFMGHSGIVFSECPSACACVLAVDCQSGFLVSLHCMQSMQMWPVVADVAWFVCLSVSLCVCVYRNGRIDGGAIWRVTRVGPRNHVLGGTVLIPLLEGAFWGTSFGLL